MKNIKQEQGVTLIALIIMIILILILTKTAVTILAGSDGIVNETETSLSIAEISSLKEKISDDTIQNIIGNYSNLEYDRKTKIVYLKKNNGEREIIIELTKIRNEDMYLEHVHYHEYAFYNGETEIGTEHPTSAGEYVEKCKTCGEIKETHTMTENVPIDGVNHYTYLCTCGIKGNIVKHTSSSDATNTTPQTCTVCGMKLLEIKNVTITGYDVYVYGIDENEVDRVQFPSWTNNNGQDDLRSNWYTNSTASGTYQGNGTWYYRVNISDHNNEVGIYYTQYYVYKNSTSWDDRLINGSATITVPTENEPLYIKLWQYPQAENSSSTTVIINGTNYVSTGGSTRDDLANFWYERTYTVNVPVGTEITIKSNYGSSTQWYKDNNYVKASETTKFRMPPNATSLFVVPDVGGYNNSKRNVYYTTNVILY